MVSGLLLLLQRNLIINIDALEIITALKVISILQFTAYADVDTYVDTYADSKYRGRVSIFSND